MRSFIVVLMMLLVLSACITTQKKQAYNEGFTFLFEKELKHRVNDCIAAFERDGFLYFFTNYHNNLYKVTVYKLNSGRYMEVPVIQKQSASCKDVVNTFQEPRRPLFMRVARFKSREFQGFFDNYQQDIDKLKEVINYHPIMFRRDTYWNGQRTATLTNQSLQARSLEEVENFLD